MPNAAAAVRRLQAHFPPPRFAVGEAWFMGESRRYYETLLDPQRVRATNPELLTALAEIGSGQTCFGPLPEWTDCVHSERSPVRFRNAYWQGAEWMGRAGAGGEDNFPCRPFLPQRNRECLIAGFRTQLDVETVLQWLVAIEAAATQNDEALSLRAELEEALMHCIEAYAFPARPVTSGDD
ncbi:hypothetical protein [Tahibacter caeni]|uniref:hypothetical protein n=1 Tax=Tahibacter caeni TaxID=1453545 RepID=UPI0021490977|nr:hypothetical protein [Tahibacter caeni]